MNVSNCGYLTVSCAQITGTGIRTIDVIKPPFGAIDWTLTRASSRTSLGRPKQKHSHRVWYTAHLVAFLANIIVNFATLFTVSETVAFPPVTSLEHGLSLFVPKYTLSANDLGALACSTVTYLRATNLPPNRLQYQNVWPLTTIANELCLFFFTLPQQYPKSMCPDRKGHMCEAKAYIPQPTFHNRQKSHKC